MCMMAKMLENVYEGLNAHSKVYLSKVKKQSSIWKETGYRRGLTSAVGHGIVFFYMVKPNFCVASKALTTPTGPGYIIH